MSKHTLFRAWLSGIVISIYSAIPQISFAADAGAPPPPAVDVFVIKEAPLNLTERFSARVVAVDAAEVRPQVGGIILERLFEEGSRVEAGDHLYQIDPALYEAELESAKAQLEIAQVNARNAQRLASRYAELSKTSAVSKQQYEDAVASREQANAQILAAQASVKRAEINLNYTQIKAPISGVISRSAVNQGSLVSAQQSQPLATIRSLASVNVDIPVPVRALLALRQHPAVTRQPVQLYLEDGTHYPVSGEIQFIESDVEESAGTVTLRAEFANPDGVLLPGMYVRADLVTAQLDLALLAPQRGVVRTPTGGASALVVNAENQVEQRSIVASRTVGDSWLIEEGLAEGDQVIVSGLQKVRPGASVTPQIINSDAAN